MEISKLITLPKLHNEFRIRVIDSKDESQKDYKANNIVLNQVYKGILENKISSGKFKMHVGDGTGVADPTRTSLFSKIGEYTLINTIETTVSKDLFTLEGNIVIPENALIGKTIREIGVFKDGFSYGLINHAQLKDSAGNPISIGPKTKTQKIEIYLTIYAERGLGMKEFPNSLSMLLSAEKWGYLNDYYKIQPADFFIHFNWVYNDATKTATSSVGRLAASDGQMIKPIMRSTMDILEITSGLLEPIKFPNTDVFPTFSFSERKIGVGDGETTEFNLESGFFNEGSINLLVDGEIQTKGIDYTTQQGGRQIINYKSDFLVTTFGDWVMPDVYQSNSSKDILKIIQKDADYNSNISSIANQMIFDFKKIIDLPTEIGIFFVTNYRVSIKAFASEDGTNWVPIPGGFGNSTHDAIDPVTIKKLRYLYINIDSGYNNPTRFYIQPAYGIKFTTPPPIGKEIRASWSTNIPPKNENLFYDLQIAIKGSW